MFTRARIAAVSAGAGLLVAGAVTVGSLTGAPQPAYAAWLDGAATEQVAQAQPQPKPSGPRGPGQGHRGGNVDPAKKQQMRDQYLNSLARNLGVDRARVEQAFKQTHIDTLNQAVQDGRLTRQQADEKIQRINSGQPPKGPRSGR